MRQLLHAGMLFGLLLGTRSIQAQEGSSLLRFVPPDAVAVVIAHPKRAMEGPGMELYPREIITAAGLQNLGIDPLQIEQLLVFVEPPSAAGPPAMGAAMLMAGAQDPAKILPMIMQGATPATLAGKPFYRAAEPDMPSVMLPNDRTIVVAPEQSLAKIISPRPADSQLLKLLKAAPAERQVTATVVLDPVRELIRAQLAQMPPLPPPFEQLKQLPEQLSSVELRLNVATAMDVELNLRSPNAATAQQVQDTLITAMTMGKQIALAQVARQAASQDPVEQAAARYAQRLADHFVALLRPQLAGDRVTIALKGDGNMATSGVLVALLLPAVQAAREAAHRAQGSNNLKQIGLAMHNYHDIYQKLPARATTDASGKPLLSWRVAILPLLEQKQLYDQFKLDEPWDSEHNKKLIAQMPPVYLLPGRAAGDGKTTYLLPAGTGTINEGAQVLKFRNLVDGLSNTIMCVEAHPERAVIWTKPDDLEINAEQPLDGLANARPGGFTVLFADGSVEFISQTIDAQMLRALFSPAGGEVVQRP